MEDVLDVYHRPYDEKRPLVCLDESSKQLIGETIQPIPAAPGQPERFDHEYVRNGVMNLFMITMPLLGWRAVQVTDRRTMLDFAEVIRWLVEEVHEEAEKVVLVMDNLNTHKIASLYEAFPPEQARRIAEKLEIHYTPKHGSLAEHGGDRAIGVSPPVPGPTDRDQGGPGAACGGVGRGTQRARRPDQVAVHHGGCQDQAPQALPDYYKHALTPKVKA